MMIFYLKNTYQSSTFSPNIAMLLLLEMSLLLLLWCHQFELTMINHSYEIYSIFFLRIPKSLSLNEPFQIWHLIGLIHKSCKVYHYAVVAFFSHHFYERKRFDM